MQPLDLSGLLNCCEPLQMVQTEKITTGCKMEKLP